MFFDVLLSMICVYVIICWLFSFGFYLIVEDILENDMDDEYECHINFSHYFFSFILIPIFLGMYVSENIFNDLNNDLE